MNKQQKEVQQALLNNEKKVLEALKQNYEDALLGINSNLQYLMNREDADMQHVIYQAEYQRALKDQIEGILNQLNNSEFETVSEYLTHCYEEGFVGTMYDLQSQGIPLIFPIDQANVVQAIQHDTKLSTSLYAAFDMKDLKKKISGEISRGISSAVTYNEIARNISGHANVNLNNAMRIARTEGHRINIKSAMDAQQKAREKGADIVKQWDASLDGKTRPHHRELDGQIRELDEDFEYSGGTVSAPAYFGTPSEDCNCRCALLQRARWALGEDITKYSPDAVEEISDDGVTKLEKIKAKDYDDFKKKYMSEAEKLAYEKNASERVRSNAQKMNKMSAEEHAAVNARRAAYFERQRSQNINATKQETRPDLSAMSASEIKDYANNTLKTEFVGMNGANNDFIRSAVKVIDDFEQKNGGTIEGLKVQFGGTPSGVFAKYDDKTNTLLLKKTGSIQAFEQKQIEDNLRFKLKWKTDKDYYATTTYSGTVAHELGHAVDFSTGQALSKELSSTSKLDELSVKISNYAGSSQNVRVSKRSEAWAENFAAYMEGGKSKEKVPDEIKAMIEDYFKRK